MGAKLEQKPHCLHAFPTFQSVHHCYGWVVKTKKKRTSADIRDRTVNLHKAESDRKTIAKRLGEEKTTAVTISERKKYKLNHQLFPVLRSVELSGRTQDENTYDLLAVGTTVTRKSTPRRTYSCLAMNIYGFKEGWREQDVVRWDQCVSLACCIKHIWKEDLHQDLTIIQLLSSLKVEPQVALVHVGLFMVQDNLTLLKGWMGPYVGNSLPSGSRRSTSESWRRPPPVEWIWERQVDGSVLKSNLVNNF